MAPKPGAGYSRALVPSYVKPAEALEALLGRLEALRQEFAHDPPELRRRLDQLRREHHIFIISMRMANSSKQVGGVNSEHLRRAAALVVDKVRYLATAANAEERRTEAEERYYNSARQSWHQLLKKAGIHLVQLPDAPFNVRSSEARSVARRMVSLKRGNLEPPEAVSVLKEHVAQRLRELIALCDEASAIDVGYSVPELRSSLRDLEERLK